MHRQRKRIIVNTSARRLPRAEQVVDDLETLRALGVVDGRDVDEALGLRVDVVAQEAAQRHLTRQAARGGGLFSDLHFRIVASLTCRTSGHLQAAACHKPGGTCNTQWELQEQARPLHDANTSIPIV